MHTHIEITHIIICILEHAIHICTHNLRLHAMYMYYAAVSECMSLRVHVYLYAHVHVCVLCNSERVD